MTFPDKEWLEITGIQAYKCVGGPLHNKWQERKHGDKFPLHMPKGNSALYVEYYYLTKNYETNKQEWVWGPLLQKKKRKWTKKRQIEQLCLQIEYLAFNNSHIQEHVRGIMPLVIKL